MKLNEKIPVPINRRKFLLFAIGGVATIVTYKFIKPSRILFGESSMTAEHINWMPSEYVQNWEKTLKTLFQLQYDGEFAELLFVDQNGNVIDNKVISTNHEIKDAKGVVIQAWTKARKRFAQEWLNAWRSEIYSRYPSIEFALDLDEERPKQMNARSSVKKTSYNSYIERVLDYGSKNMLGLENLTISRIAYAKKVFSLPSQLGTEEPINLPAGIRKRLSEISYGIAGIESGFDNSQISPAKAQGVWQIMPSTFSHICKKLGVDADYSNLITTTAVANRYCEDAYDYLIVHCEHEFDFISTEFGLSKQDLENYFIFPCIVNSYNAGKGRLKNVIHWFAENYTKDKLNQKVGTYPKAYGYDLFGQMIRICYEEKAVYGYRRQSWEYFLRAYAMAALIREKYDVDVDLRNKLTEKEYQPPKALLVKDSFLRESIDVGFAAGVGVASVKLYDVISKMDFQKNGFAKKISKLIKPQKKIFIAFGSLIALIVGFSMISDSDNSPWGNIEVNPTSWGEIKYSGKLAQELLTLPKLFTKNPSRKYYQIKMPRRIQAKLITPWMKKHHLFQAIYPNRAAILKAAKTHELIQLSYSGNQYYRCRTVGFNQIKADKAKGVNTQVVGTRNHPDYLYAKPSTAKMVNRISQLVNKELHEKFGLNAKYRIRLIVNSGIRDTAYNKKLRGSSPNSTHQLGMAVDFSTNGVDVIKNKTKTFIHLSHKQGRSVNKKHRVTYKAIQALKSVLVKLHKAGKLFAIKEGGHYHVTDKEGML